MNVATLDRLRVLVIDDCADTTLSLVRLMALWGYDAKAANGKEEAVAEAIRHRPNVVLFDVALEGRDDGYEVVMSLRLQPELRGTTFICVSGYATLKDKERSRQVGAKYHLVKPV